MPEIVGTDYDHAKAERECRQVSTPAGPIHYNNLNPTPENLAFIKASREYYTRVAEEQMNNGGEARMAAALAQNKADIRSKFSQSVVDKIDKDSADLARRGFVIEKLS